MTDRIDVLTVVLALTLIFTHSFGYVAFEDAVIIMLAGIWTEMIL